jgi:hypothetical protein
MKNEGFGKHLFAAFGLALIAYAVVYYAIEQRRTRNGPWQVTFTNTATGLPAIIINQPRLAITDVQIVFDGEAATTNVAVTMVFNQARKVPYDVPFGRCDFMDLISMPGSVTFELFGHQVQLMPRVLTVDHEEIAWRSGQTMTLTQTNQPMLPSKP